MVRIIIIIIILIIEKIEIITIWIIEIIHIKEVIYDKNQKIICSIYLSDFENHELKCQTLVIIINKYTIKYF